jgi:hypothetical protein
VERPSSATYFFEENGLTKQCRYKPAAKRPNEAAVIEKIAAMPDAERNEMLELT